MNGVYTMFGSARLLVCICFPVALLSAAADSNGVIFAQKVLDHFTVYRPDAKQYGWAVNTWGEHTSEEEMRAGKAGWISVLGAGGVCKEVCTKFAKKVPIALYDEKKLGSTDPLKIFSALVTSLNRTYADRNFVPLRALSVMLHCGERYILATGRQGLAGFVPTLQIIQDEQLLLMDSSWHHVMENDALSPRICYNPCAK